MADVECRRAVAKDYQDVMDIGVMYDGYDYVPALYHEFISDPDYRSYVCIVKGEIISYSCALVHDGGAVLQSRAERTKETHRAKGYNKTLTAFKHEDQRDYTTAEYRVYIKSLASVQWSKLDPDIHLVDTFSQFKLQVIPTALSPQSQSLPETQILTNSHLQHIFSSDEYIRRLFPRRIVYSGMVAFGLHASNIRHINNHRSKVLASIKQDNRKVVDKSETDTIFPKTEADFHPDMADFISVGIQFPLKTRHKLIIHLCGENLNYAYDHVIKHMSLVKTHSTQLSITLLTSTAVDPNRFKDYYAKGILEDVSVLSNKMFGSFKTKIN